MKLWTVWIDYFATGEGRTVMAWVGYAGKEVEARAGFAKQFAPLPLEWELFERLHSSEADFARQGAAHRHIARLSAAGLHRDSKY